MPDIQISTAPATLDDAVDYLTVAIGSFAGDPPDDDFQRGYRAALAEMKQWIDETREPVR